MVTISSLGPSHLGHDRFRRPAVGRAVQPVAGYGQSKLANLLFTYELARRLKVKGAPTIALAAHPGASDTELLRNLPGLIRRPAQFVCSRYAQSAAMGALPPLRAATDPNAQSGQYYGPDGLGEQRGHPKVVDSSAQSHDEDIQRRLWTRFRRAHRRHVSGLTNAFRRRAPARRRRPDHTAPAGRHGARRHARAGARRGGGGAAVAARLRQLGHGRLRRRRRRYRRGERRTAGAAARRRGHPRRPHRSADAETRYGTPDHDGCAAFRPAPPPWCPSKPPTARRTPSRSARPPKPGQHIRRAGEDVTAGTTVLRAGQVVTPAVLGLAAALGLGELTVVPRQRVLVMSTGSELVAPGTPLKPGQIYESNAFMLAAAVRDAGARRGRIADDR